MATSEQFCIGLGLRIIFTNVFCNVHPNDASLVGRKRGAGDIGRSAALLSIVSKILASIVKMWSFTFQCSSIVSYTSINGKASCSTRPLLVIAWCTCTVVVTCLLLQSPAARRKRVSIRWRIWRCSRWRASSTERTVWDIRHHYHHQQRRWRVSSWWALCRAPPCLWSSRTGWRLRVAGRRCQDVQASAVMTTSHWSRHCRRRWA